MFIQNLDIQCVYEGFGLVGALFISNLQAAQDEATLKTHWIKAVVSLGNQAKLTHSSAVIPHYLYIPDSERDEALDVMFDLTFQFIEMSRKNSNVLIHCQNGTAASSAVVISYLIRKYRYTFEYVSSLLKYKRTSINPSLNPNPTIFKCLNELGNSYGLKELEEDDSSRFARRIKRIRRSYSAMAKPSKSLVRETQYQQFQISNPEEKMKFDILMDNRVRLSSQLNKLKNERSDSKADRQTLTSEIRNTEKLSPSNRLRQGCSVELPVMSARKSMSSCQSYRNHGNAY